MEDDDHSAQLKELLTAKRAAVDPAWFGERLDQFSPRTGPGLTQHDLGTLTGKSGRHVGNLESGRAANPSAVWLESIVTVLGMSPDERILLYRLAVGHDPFPDLTLTTLPSGVRPPWEAILQATAYPGYVSGPFWDVEFCNSQYEELLPGFDLAGHRNVMRYCLLDKDARENLLLNWLEDWAVPMVAQVKSAMPILREHERMQALVEDLRTDAVVDRLWRGIPHDVMTKVHPNGDQRAICHPRFGRQTLYIAASTPMGYDGHRIIVLVPTAMPAQPSASAQMWRGYGTAAAGAAEAMRDGGGQVPRPRKRSTRFPALGWSAGADPEQQEQ